MRILIASTQVPFVRGGSDKIVEDLFRELVHRGFEVDKTFIPFHSDWTDVPRQTLGIRLLDVTESCGERIDRVIAVRYPSYALRHPNKVAWFIHHHRPAYDLWGTPMGGMPDTPVGRHYRDMMHRSDNTYLRECRKVFTNSEVVADRLRRFNALDPAAVLYPPLPRDHPFRPGPYGDYLFYASRLDAIKRQHLAIEALQFTSPEVRLVIAGTAEDPQYSDHLHRVAEDCGVSDRVRFTGWISEQEKADWLAGCCAALYLAYDEDSYGYATLEAFHSAKPVITLTDSGGPLEVIRDGQNGRVVEPNARALAEAMNGYWEDRIAARDAGWEALQTPDCFGIDWDHVVENLTT